MKSLYPLPNKTPKSLKILLFFMVFLSIISLISNLLLSNPLLLVTQKTVSNLHLWQPITSLFVIPATSLSFSFLMLMCARLLAFWGLCHFLIEKKGLKSFWISLGFSTTFILLSTLFTIHLYPLSTPFSTNSILLSSLVVGYIVWSSPKLKLPLPLNYTLQVKWVIVALLTLLIGVDFFTANLKPSLFILSSQILFTYLWERNLSKRGSNKLSPSSLFFKTQKAIKASLAFDDDAFLEAVLSKISLYGEKVLTEDERKRMEIISLKKGSAKNFL